MLIEENNLLLNNIKYWLKQITMKKEDEQKLEYMKNIIIESNLRTLFDEQNVHDYYQTFANIYMKQI